MTYDTYYSNRNGHLVECDCGPCQHALMFDIMAEPEDIVCECEMCTSQDGEV